MIKLQVASISVVIPAYNRAKTIRYCLDSVLQQTLSPLEVLVVDDCSTDETVEIVNSYNAPRVKGIVLDKNSGAQAARNRGIREAKGDWIAFQDSDDEWRPDKLEKQVRALAEVGFDPWTVVHTNAVWLDTATGNQLTVDVPLVEGNNVYPLLLTMPAPMFPGMLVSRLALEKISLLDEKVPSYQEWDTSIQLAKYCRFIYLREPLFVYHLHKEETISKDRKRDIEGYQYILDKFESEIKRVCGEEVWERHLFNQLIKCLNFKLWSESDRYFKLVGSRDYKFRVFQFCRWLHLPPQILFRFKETLFGKK